MNPVSKNLPQGTELYNVQILPKMATFMSYVDAHLKYLEHIYFLSEDVAISAAEYILDSQELRPRFDWNIRRKSTGKDLTYFNVIVDKSILQNIEAKRKKAIFLIKISPTINALIFTNNSFHLFYKNFIGGTFEVYNLQQRDRR